VARELGAGAVVEPPTERALAGPAGATPIARLRAVAAVRSFVSGDPHGDRIRIRYYRIDDPNTLTARVWFGPGAEGPPGHAHGGASAAVLDEVLGGAVWEAGHKVLAAQLDTRWHAPLPLGVVMTATATVSAVDGRKIRVRGAIRDDAGRLHAEAEGLYVALADDRLAAFAPWLPGSDTPDEPLG
jgi:acyl-coenzyme A thioesterase PaaI-like protein